MSGVSRGLRSVDLLESVAVVEVAATQVPAASPLPEPYSMLRVAAESAELCWPAAAEAEVSCEEPLETIFEMRVESAAEMPPRERSPQDMSQRRSPASAGSLLADSIRRQQIAQDERSSNDGGGYNLASVVGEAVELTKLSARKLSAAAEGTVAAVVRVSSTAYCLTTCCLLLATTSTD